MSPEKKMTATIPTPRKAKGVFIQLTAAISL